MNAGNVDSSSHFDVILRGDQFESLDHLSEQMKDFLRPQTLATHAIWSDYKDDALAVALGPRFNASIDVEHKMLSENEVESARLALATHPDQRALNSVMWQLNSQFNLPLTAGNVIAEHLQLRTNLKQQLEFALTRDGKQFHGFVLRVAASFAHACGLSPFPVEALVVACGWKVSSLGRYGHLNTADWGVLKDMVFNRIWSVYWFEEHLGARLTFGHSHIVSGIFGQLADGQWFYYKDRCPSLTNCKSPKFPGSGYVLGGAFHGSYVAQVGPDLQSLLAIMDRADVIAIIESSPGVKHAVTNRAFKLQRLFKVAENVLDQGDSRQCYLELAQSLLQAAKAEYSLWKQAGQHDPIALWDHLVKVHTLEIWDRGLSRGYGSGEVRRPWGETDGPAWLDNGTPDMFALLNCLRTFHSVPRTPIDVPLEELRYTHCSISAVFSHGKHAGLPLNRTVDELVSGSLKPRSQAMVLNVVVHQGKFFSLSNRRLWCLKTYALSTGRSLFARVFVWPLARGLLLDGQEVCEKFGRSLTTMNGGVSVELRFEEQDTPHLQVNASDAINSIFFSTHHSPEVVQTALEHAMVGDVRDSSPSVDFLHVVDPPNDSTVGPTIQSSGKVVSLHVDTGIVNEGEASTFHTPRSPVAQIDPVEAAKIAGEQWASWVQHRAWDAALSGARLPTTLVVLRFSRHEQVLEDAVLQSEVARRAQEHGADLCPAWAHGGKVLVAGVGPEFFDHDLELFNVVVKEEDETALLRELAGKLSRKQRQLKAGCARMVVPDQLSLFDVSRDGTSSSTSEYDIAGWRVHRTFIDIPRVRNQVHSSVSW